MKRQEAQTDRQMRKNSMRRETVGMPEEAMRDARAAGGRQGVSSSRIGTNSKGRGSGDTDEAGGQLPTGGDTRDSCTLVQTKFEMMDTSRGEVARRWRQGPERDAGPASHASSAPPHLRRQPLPKQQAHPRTLLRPLAFIPSWLRYLPNCITVDLQPSKYVFDQPRIALSGHPDLQRRVELYRTMSGQALIQSRVTVPRQGVPTGLQLLPNTPSQGVCKPSRVKRRGADQAKNQKSRIREERYGLPSPSLRSLLTVVSQRLRPCRFSRGCRHHVWTHRDGSSYATDKHTDTI